MRLSEGAFEWAAVRINISPTQSGKIWKILKGRRKPRWPINFAFIAYVLGAVLIAAAFIGPAKDSYTIEPKPLHPIYPALGVIVFSLLGYFFWFRKGWRTAGGILFVSAICLVPFALDGALEAAGISGSRELEQNGARLYKHTHGLFLFQMNVILKSLGTIVAALIALQFVNYSLLAAPIPISMFVIKESCLELLQGQNFILYAGPSGIALGIGMNIIAVLIDKRFREDYAIWFYIVGAVAICESMERLFSEKDILSLSYLSIYLGMIAVAILLSRVVYLVIGLYGISNYISHLVGDQLQFPYSRITYYSCFGILLIFSGIKYYQHRAAIDAFATRLFPWRKRLLRSERLEAG